MKKIILIPFLLLLAGCSDSGSDGSLSSYKSENSFPPLPTSESESVVLSGNMSFWMYEGDAGCFGAITDGTAEVQLWVDVDACGEKEYAENESASVEVTFRADNQYGPGKTYTITKFL